MMSRRSKSAVLVGFQDQGNLGLGYLASVLQVNGFSCSIVDIGRGPDAILSEIRSSEPLVVGFSLIFQYYLPQYAALAGFLRSRGIECHFTIGGHFPSLWPEKTLDAISELDSVVRFEGEETLLDLMHRLDRCQQWRNIPGIAYVRQGNIVKNSLRPLVSNLDELPYPYRTSFTNSTLGRLTQPVLATRGCPRDCAFCSIREFYSQAPGKRVRRRSPANVADEISALHHDHGVSIFLFQDDDFPVIGNAGRRWVSSFIEELESRKLIGQIVWKISCRVDEIDFELFTQMKNAGLYLVYLGIESGNSEGLRTLNKQVTIDEIVTAVSQLKQMGLMYAYGYMLFDPGSTFSSIRENARFLSRLIGDGSAPTVFCKMLPYAGTAVFDSLAASGRLRGTTAQPDYDFLDPALDEYYRSLDRSMRQWVHGKESVSHNLSAALHETAVIRSLFPPLAGIRPYEAVLRKLTKKANNLVLSAIHQSSTVFETRREFPFSAEVMDRKAQKFIGEIIDRRNTFILRNQDQMLASIDSKAG